MNASTEDRGAGFEQIKTDLPFSSVYTTNGTRATDQIYPEGKRAAGIAFGDYAGVVHFWESLRTSQGSYLAFPQQELEAMVEKGEVPFQGTMLEGAYTTILEKVMIEGEDFVQPSANY